MRRVPSLMSSTVAVNKLITLPPEPLTVTTRDGVEKIILPPTVHIGLQSLNVRLISVNKRVGMVRHHSTDASSPYTYLHAIRNNVSITRNLASKLGLMQYAIMG